METNSFDLGIAPGGLREKADIKLLVCYLLKTIGKTLTRTQINDAFQENQIANYFEINAAISELIEGGQVGCEDIDGEQYLTVSLRTSIEVLEIENLLPRSIREKAVNAGLKIYNRDKIKKESEVEVVDLRQGHHVTFRIFDMGTKLFELTIYVADSSQIEIVKTNFFDNAVSIYSDLISALTVK
ncbi:MAG: DUF4364 family protein [Clostridia bacterium]